MFSFLRQSLQTLLSLNELQPYLWPPVTFERLAAQNGRTGALLVGDPEEVAEKILGHSAALRGINRSTFQLDNANLTHQQLKNTMQLIAEKVKPIINQE